MKLRSRIFTAIIAVGLISTTLVGCNSNNTSQSKDNKEAATTLDKLTITHVTAPLNVPSIIQKNKNIFAETFKENGKPLEIKYAEIMSGADQTQALASGDVDILYAVGGTSVIAAAANGADIKVLNMYSRSPEAFCLYSKDENIKSPEDLRGKTVAGPVGTILHQLLIAYLKTANMTIEDINYVNMSIPDAKAALDGGSIDAALVAGAVAYKSNEQGYHLVTNGVGLTDANIAVAVRGDFYNKHKEELKIFLDAQKDIIEYIDKNHNEAMEIVAKELDLDKAAVEEMYGQYDFNINITEEDKKAFQDIADFMYETKMIEEKFDTKTLFINE